MTLRNDTRPAHGILLFEGTHFLCGSVPLGHASSSSFDGATVTTGFGIINSSAQQGAVLLHKKGEI